MFSMIVMTCIIWIEGSRYDRGEAKCGIHKAALEYTSRFECEIDIPKYERYVINSIYDQFEPPFADIILNTMCYENFGEEK